MNLDDLVLIRSWVNQVDEQALNDYADLEREPVRKSIARIRKTLAGKARYYGKPEWAALWESRSFPVESWIRKALASLEALHRLPEPKISLDDGIDQWLPEKQIKAVPAQLHTIGELMDYFDAYYAGSIEFDNELRSCFNVIVGFLDQHEGQLGRSLKKRMPRPRFLATRAGMPAGGVGGSAVAEALIQASNDWEAATIWLKTRAKRSRHTFESYYREANRLLVWLEERQLSLADLKVDHVEQYYAHLRDPPGHWLRPRKPTRAQSARLSSTQLLAGRLSVQSIDHARTVLSQLCDYLQKAGYLRHNVFRLTSRPAIITRTEATRYLDLASWQWLWQWLTQMPRTTARESLQAGRARWLFSLLYHTGIRREEAANATMGDFILRDYGWSLIIVGKRNKEKIITVNSMLLKELVAYRQALNLRDYPSPAESTPLVTSINPNKKNLALTPRAISGIIKDISARAVQDCQDEQVRAQIENMTTHWLRHTNATHRLMAGASLETTQDELGHADPRTTRIYAKTTDLGRREDAEKLAALLDNKLIRSVNFVETKE